MTTNRPHDTTPTALRGELLYGNPNYVDSAPFSVWEQTDTGRVRHLFDDEFLAMQAAVALSSRVETMNGSHEPRG